MAAASEKSPPARACGGSNGGIRSSGGVRSRGGVRSNGGNLTGGALPAARCEPARRVLPPCGLSSRELKSRAPPANDAEPSELPKPPEAEVLLEAEAPPLLEAEAPLEADVDRPAAAPPAFLRGPMVPEPGNFAARSLASLFDPTSRVRAPRAPPEPPKPDALSAGAERERIEGTDDRESPAPDRECPAPDCECPAPDRD